MEYVVFRLAMRCGLPSSRLPFCVSHLVRKRDFIDAVFRSPDEVRKSFSGRNGVLFLRVLNIIPMRSWRSLRWASSSSPSSTCPGLSTGITLRIEGVMIGRARRGGPRASARSVSIRVKTRTR